MADEKRRWTRQGEDFWRAHHEGWKRSDLNQRQYCEVHGLPPKAFENWRQKFRVEPEPIQRRLLHRRRRLSPILSHGLSHSLSHTPSHGAYPSSQSEGAIVPPPREGHRRRFTEADKHRIVEAAAQPGASVAEVARRYRVDRRVLCRWRQQAALPIFVTVQIADATAPDSEEAIS